MTLSATGVAGRVTRGRLPLGCCRRFGAGCGQSWGRRRLRRCASSPGPRNRPAGQGSLWPAASRWAVMWPSCWPASTIASVASRPWGRRRTGRGPACGSFATPPQSSPKAMPTHIRSGSRTISTRAGMLSATAQERRSPSSWVRPIHHVPAGLHLDPAGAGWGGVGCRLRFVGRVAMRGTARCRRFPRSARWAPRAARTRWARPGLCGWTRCRSRSRRSTRRV